MFSRDFPHLSPILVTLSPGPCRRSPGFPQPGTVGPAPRRRVVDTGAVSVTADSRAADAALALGEAVEDWTGDAQFHEYSAAVDPVGTGIIGAVPIRRFGAEDPADGTRVVELDLAGELGTPYPATGPSVLARFVCIEPGAQLELAPNATSTLLYCLRGRGTTMLEGAAGTVTWKAGDVITLPGPGRAHHSAQEPSVLYHVDDSPLLAYLGVTASAPRFAPTRFDGERARARLAEIAAHPDAATRSRVAVLLANARNDRTLTATHTLWVMLGVLPAGRVQRPHRHQSVAVDLVVDCRPGCYSLLGSTLDGDGAIVDPVRVDWESGGAFVTPPGRWHSHHNESGAPAHILPVQDAGLHTYLRTLDITFTRP